MHALSLDMGGSHIGCAVVKDRHVLARTSIGVADAQNLASLLPKISETLCELANAVGVDCRGCAGLAIGFPGIVDARTNRILSTLQKYEDAPHLNLDQWARDTFGIRIRMDNDARLALLGEQNAGAAEGIQNVVMMTLGTGIGGAALIEGKLLRGVHAQAGCLGGHLAVDFKGRSCSCGNIGCAEAEASGWALAGIVRAMPGVEKSCLAGTAAMDFRTLFQAAEQRDEVACRVIERCLDVWAANVVSLIHAYDPEVVVIGGGIMQSADRILPALQRYVEEHAWTPWGTPQVRAARLGSDAAFLGAIPLLNEELG